jgi:hypothetical protein
MATTTNYGWTTPDDTALVKDGASAIRTLGSSIDTTTKALNPSTTLGDIEYRSSTANTNTRLPLGTAGQVLAVNSGATAPEWTTVSGGGMTLISTTSLSGSSVTLSSIPQTYKHLYVRVTEAYAAANSNVLIQLNGDTGSNYTWGLVYLVSGGSPAGSGIVGTTSIRSGVMATSTGSFACDLIIEIPNYTDTSGVQLVQSNGMYAIERTTINSAGLYHNRTAGISSIRFSSNSTYSGGTVRLYGVN